MIYFITNGGYTIDENNTIIPMIESSSLYQDYLTYIIEGNEVFTTSYKTPEEIADSILYIRKEYSHRISSIDGLQEAIERKLIDGTEIPQNLLDERELLKEEYRIRILLIN